MLNPPPDPFDLNPLIEPWPADVRIHRVHQQQYRASQFNECQGDPTRFAPIYDEQGKCISTLYGADKQDGAFSETVFHNIPKHAKNKWIDINDLSGRVYSIIQPKFELQLVSLRDYGLHRLHLERKDIIDTEADMYAITARWAEAFHRWNKDVQGIIWQSRQFESSAACLLFGDRISEDDFVQMGESKLLTLNPVLNDLQVAADKAGITILY